MPDGKFQYHAPVFVGLVIGWFYCLFHGQRSKTAAYATVGICTVSASVLWVVLALLALLPVFVSPAPFTAADLGRLWGKVWELLLLCAGLGLTGFFFSRRNLLAYADWKRGPWHITYTGGNGQVKEIFGFLWDKDVIRDFINVFGGVAMILGNPYKFAVLSGVINEWNLDDTFGNGVFKEPYNRQAVI